MKRLFEYIPPAILAAVVSFFFGLELEGDVLLLRSDMDAMREELVVVSDVLAMLSEDVDVNKAGLNVCQFEVAALKSRFTNQSSRSGNSVGSCQSMCDSWFSAGLSLGTRSVIELTASREQCRKGCEVLSHRRTEAR